MSKDTIFKDYKEIKEVKTTAPIRSLSLLPKRVVSSYYLSHPIPHIDFKKYIRLLPDDIVQQGDEYHFGDKWHTAHISRCGSFVDCIFIYRRKRQGLESQ